MVTPARACASGATNCGSDARPTKGPGLEREKAVGDRAVRSALSSVILATVIPDGRFSRGY